MSDFGRDHVLSLVKPRPPEHLWRVYKASHTLDADLEHHSESDGIELHVLCDGVVLFRRRYDRRELATAEAHALLQHYRAEGWTVPADRSAPRSR